MRRPVTEPITTVTGQWNVNGISPLWSPSGSGFADGTYLCGVWIGIDGTAGTSDVLQAGTGSLAVVKNGKFESTSFFAWTEWFSLGSVVVANFPVAVGDLISCTVCAPFGNTHGTALFNNLTSGLTTSIGIDPPAGTSLSGNVAEWIVEDPTNVSNNLLSFPELWLDLLYRLRGGHEEYRAQSLGWQGDRYGPRRYNAVVWSDTEQVRAMVPLWALDEP